MDFVSGFVASTIAMCITHPIDIVKTRYQINNSPQSISKIAWKIHNNRGFYRGLVPNILTFPVFWAVFFQIKETDVCLTGGNVFVDKFVNSFIAGNIASTITNPLFVLKARFQGTDNNRLDIIKDLNKNRFIFFRGLSLTYLNNLKLGVQLPLYDYFKSKTDNVVFSSLTSKLICSVVFYPLNLLRLKQRISNKNVSITSFSKDIYKKSGIKGFYRGMVLYKGVSILNFTITMYIMEFIKQY